MSSPAVAAITSGERPSRNPAAISRRRPSGRGQNGTEACASRLARVAAAPDAEDAEDHRRSSHERQHEQQGREPTTDQHASTLPPATGASARAQGRHRLSTLRGCRALPGSCSLCRHVRPPTARSASRSQPCSSEWCSSAPDPMRRPSRASATSSSAACSLPHDQLLRIWRGWRPDRGAQLSFVPKEPNFVGSGLPHVGPWDYIQTVPMLWYGPGFVRAAGRGRPSRHRGGHRADVGAAHEVRRLPSSRRPADDRGAAPRGRARDPEAAGHDGVGRRRHQRARGASRTRGRSRSR